tara:strand:- start:311 stop:469 length:159 start_codon:yes stop_codon:yes gene_type:complete
MKEIVKATAVINGHHTVLAIVKGDTERGLAEVFKTSFGAGFEPSTLEVTYAS